MSTAQRTLQVWPIVAGILVAGILLLAASDFLGAWVRDRLRAEERVKVVEAVSPALEDYQREQADLLGNYGWVDQENGVVQLPIERAMELVAEEEGGEQ